MLEKIAQDNYALYLLTFPSLEKVHSFTYSRYKKETWPYLKFASKDKFFYRITLEKILEGYETQSLKTILS